MDVKFFMDKENLLNDKKIGEEIKENIIKNLTDSLKVRGGIPGGSTIETKIDFESGKIEHYFIKDKNGKIIKFADLRKNDAFLKILKEYFRGSYIDETGKYLTDSEIEQYIDELADIYLETKEDEDNQIEN